MIVIKHEFKVHLEVVELADEQEAIVDLLVVLFCRIVCNENDDDDDDDTELINDIDLLTILTSSTCSR